MIPQKTAQIFDTLAKGKFLCDNYPNSEHRQLYSLVDDNYDDLYEYFLNIGYVLNKEIGYFYFSKEETSQNIETKLNSVLRFIDLFDFMFEYSSSFGVGIKIRPSNLSEAVNTNSILKAKLSKIVKKETIYQSCKKVLDEFVSKGIMALENEEEELYIVLTSYTYIENFIESIKGVNDEPVKTLNNLENKYARS